MSHRRVAVVTGGNKGIGFAIVRGLCKKFDGDVYLTARDEGRGQAAVEELKKEGLSPLFHQLDINDAESAQNLKTTLQTKYGGLDVLVNNAGIAYKQASTAPFSEQADVTVKTNYWGTRNVCDALFPILRDHARVSHVSSQVSIMALNKCSDELRALLTSITDVQKLDEAMTEFVKLAKDGTHLDHGWPGTAYGVSKIGVTILAAIQQTNIDADTSRKDILINSCCPGYVNTDMTSGKGPSSIDEGADTPLYLALLPANVATPRGEFLVKREVANWRTQKAWTFKI